MITELKHDWRAVLSLRNTRNRMVVQLNYRASVIQGAIDELKKDGYMVWIDRYEQRRTINDVYLLTPKGVELCEKHGIKQRY